MAYITETTHNFGAGALALLNTIANSFVTFFSDVSMASTRSHFLNELQAMDDATLMAQHGIHRGEIVSYVFRDKLVP